MGAYAYCRQCDSSLPKPTVGILRDDYWVCDRNGHRNEFPRVRFEMLCEIVSDLEDRLEALEPKVEGDDR